MEENIFNLAEESLSRIIKASYRVNGFNFQPYFSASHFNLSEAIMIGIQNGALYEKSSSIYPELESMYELRMGHPGKGGSALFAVGSFPLDRNEKAIRSQLNFTANQLFWSSADMLHAKYGKSIGRKSNGDSFDYHSPAEKVEHFEAEKEILRDTQGIEEMLKQLSIEFLKKDIIKAGFDFQGIVDNRYYINTEGTRVFRSESGYGLTLQLFAIDNRNRIIPHTLTYPMLDPKDIPNYEKLLEDGLRELDYLMEIRKAPIQENGTYLTWQDHINFGVRIHEFIHNAEADKMYPSQNGSSVFKGKLGKQVAPEFLTIVDDPSRPNFGFYEFDDEGVKAVPVTVIKNGKLINYLHTRASAGYLSHKEDKQILSNGHARGQPGLPPAARMSNLIISSDNEIPHDSMRDYFIEMIRMNGLEYGLRFIDSSGGMTIPQEAFLNTYPKHVFRVYADGREERVRGIYDVSTPHNSIASVIVTGDRYMTADGMCGAESGMVDTSETAPEAIIANVEVNQWPDEEYHEMREDIIKLPKLW